LPPRDHPVQLPHSATVHAPYSGYTSSPRIPYQGHGDGHGKKALILIDIETNKFPWARTPKTYKINTVKHLEEVLTRNRF
jgi:hypothetical protein